MYLNVHEVYLIYNKSTWMQYLRLLNVMWRFSALRYELMNGKPELENEETASVKH